MLVHIRRSIVLAVVALVLTFAYAFAGTGISQLFFKHQANGSLTANGSTLIGQTWSGPKWFQGRPDADNPMATGGTNLGPRSKTLVEDTKKEVVKLEREGINPTPDLVTTSGSGVDPDIAPVDAYAQVDAVAKARGLPVATVRHLVATHIHPAELGFLGSPYIDVLQLNEALANLR